MIAPFPPAAPAAFAPPPSTDPFGRTAPTRAAKPLPDVAIPLVAEADVARFTVVTTFEEAAAAVAPAPEPTIPANRAFAAANASLQSLILAGLASGAFACASADFSAGF